MTASSFSPRLPTGFGSRARATSVATHKIHLPLPGSAIWLPLTFGKHEGKTLPQVALTDPDWLFWAEGDGILVRFRVPRAVELCFRARNIRISDGTRGARVADYVLNSSGKLSHVEVGYANEMNRSEDRGVVRRPGLDLSVAHAIAGRDKLGAERILKALSVHVFKPMGWARVTKERGESFFNDAANFIPMTG